LIDLPHFMAKGVIRQALATAAPISRRARTFHMVHYLRTAEVG